MDALNISTGEKRISITRDGAPAGEIVFNPDDVVFAEKFYRLLGDFQNSFTQYQVQARALEAIKTLDDNGLPRNMSQRIELVSNACKYTREKIDLLFGDGTSQIVFGDALSLEAIKQFFEGIAPHIQAARVEKIQKYTNKRPKRR